MKLDRTKYIMIPASQGELYNYYYKCKYGNILIKVNDESLISNILPVQYLSKYTDNYECHATVLALLEKKLLHNSDLDINTPAGFILKTDPIYDPDISNTIYLDNDRRVIINYYPYHSIVFSSEEKYYNIICGYKGTLAYVTRMYLKKALIGLYSNHEYFSLHASAICNNQKAYVFLSGSYSGKTTLFINMLSKGYAPINDDIVFLKYVNNDIVVESIPMYPSIRNESIKYLPKEIKDSIIEDNKIFGNEHVVDIVNTYKSNFELITKLNAVFIPFKGYSKNQIVEINPNDYKKTILKSFLDHYNLDINYKYLELFKSLVNIKFYKIELSENMDEIALMLDNLIKSFN